MGQLVDIGNDGSRRSDALGVFVVRNLVQLERVAFFTVRNAVVSLLRHIGDCEAGRLHVERREDFLAHELFPGFPGLQFDDVPCGRIHQVVIEEGLPHRLLRLEVLQLFEEFLPCKRGPEPDQVVPRHSGAVRQHVAKRNVVVELVVVKLNRWNRLAHRLVPSKFSHFDKHARGNGGEQF